MSVDRAAAPASGVRPGDQTALRPYVPRLVVDWLRSSPDLLERDVEGTLAFVDISGFTALTERLARKGQVGAEEMSDTLSAVFSGLLAIAYEDGAGLVKWGGDAVLLLFDGDGHAARAARAAVRMRAALRVLGDVDTSAGRVRLRMSVGIHSGTFHFFLVGDPGLHRELLVAGTAASATAAAEATAAAGQVVLTPAAASTIEPRLLRPLPDGHLLLTGEPRALAWPAPPQPDTTGLDLGSTLSAPIRAYVVSGAVEPEHRRVAVAFVQFSGTDALLAEAGTDALAAALDAVVRNVQEACDRHGVTFFETDIDADGGKIMLVAGAPTSGGSNEERLLLASRLVLDRPGVLPLRIGVNSGGVFAGDFGPEFRRTYSVKGDAVNLAARVMSRAAPGQLLATTTALAASRTSFDTEALAPFTVKGKSRPVEAASVGPARREALVGADDLPLVGREVELAALDAAVAGARASGRVVVELAGEPGIGKSRLVAELRRRAEGMRFLVAACDEYESSSPYHPFRALLREVAGLPAGGAPEDVLSVLEKQVVADDPDLVPLLPLLGVPLDIALPDTAVTADLDEQFRKSTVEQVCVRFLAAALPDPTVLVLDDVHWMDDASADLMVRLATGSEGSDRHWLLLVTRRDVPTGYVPEGDDVVRLRPAPIDTSAVLALVEQSTQDVQLPPHALEAIARRAGGNPLFLRSLLEAARSGGLPSGDTGDALPASVEGLLTSQVDQLPAGERALLRYASVLGVTFAEEHLRQMLGDTAMPTTWASLRRLAGFLEPAGHGRFRFRHALIRAAAYEGLSFRRRRELHGRVGDLLEADGADDQAEMLSMHFFYAGRSDKAWHYSRVAGDRSRAKYAYVEAAEFYSRAVASARRGEAVDNAELGLVLESLAGAQTRAGDIEEARRSYRSARRIAPDRLAVAHLLLMEARLDRHQGRTTQSMRTLTRGMHLLDAETEADATGRVDAQRAAFESFYAWGRYRQGRYREAVRWGRRAQEHAERSGAQTELAEVYAVLQQISTVSQFGHEQPYGEMALAVYAGLGDVWQQANMLNNLAGTAFFEGRWSDAVTLYGRAMRGYEQVGHQLGVASVQFNQAEILSRQGRFDDARDRLERSRGTARRYGDQELEAIALRELGRIFVATGHVAEGMKLLSEAARHSLDLGEAYEVLATDVEIAAAHLAAGDSKTAVEQTRHALSRARALGAQAQLPTIGRLLGLALLALGQVDEAVMELETTLARCEEQGSYETGFVLLALADAQKRRGDQTAAETLADARKRLSELDVLDAATAGG